MSSVLFVHPRFTAAMKTLLSSRYLELLSGNLVALLFDLSFKFVEIDGLGFFYRVLQNSSQVDLLRIMVSSPASSATN